MLRKLSLLLIILALILVACGGNTTPEPTTAPVEEPQESEPVEEAEPEEAEEPAAENGDRPILRLATTTSTENSGLLEYLLPVFEEQYSVDVDVVAVGTGQALQLGRDGNADVLMVHARAQEDEFMAEGHGVRREDLMYNDFVIVGPPSDPAGVRGMTDVAAALTAIAEAEAPFVSRGDDSGTHVKELELWEAAGIAPEGGWYIASGQGMGPVLTMADEQEAYALSDRATYLARTLEGTQLETLVEGDERLFNPYGVIAVNPDKNEQIQVDLANTFIDWLIAVETQELIAQFGVDDFGQSLFIPDSAQWNEAQGN